MKVVGLRCNIGASGREETGFNELGFEYLYLCCLDALRKYRIFQSSQTNITISMQIKISHWIDGTYMMI
jgi:hypothetical protein